MNDFNETVKYLMDARNQMMSDCVAMTSYTPVYTVPCPPISNSDIYKTDCPAPAPNLVTKSAWGCKQKKEENPMASYASAQIIADTTEKDQREYITSRLRTMKYEKLAAFETQFGLVDDHAPKTPAAFVKRIADGLYTIDKEKMDKETYNAAGYIRWRDPSIMEDKDGYKAASGKLDEAYRSAKDAAILSPIAEAKTAMDAFKAWSLS